ncbi:MAG: SPASM domain-containing protein [Treponema sp.]|nr:SPASM domain-containing protein [Treponema sp.]
MLDYAYFYQGELYECIQNALKNERLYFYFMYPSKFFSIRIDANDYDSIQFVSKACNVWSEEKIKSLKEQASMLGDIFISFYERNIPITISLISNYIENTLLNFSKPICGAVTDYIAIVPDGNILPCGGFVGCQNEDDMIIGNIYDGINLKNIEFYLDKSNEDALKVNNDCSGCKILKRCQHNCFAINNRINNDRNKTCLPACIVNQLFIIESDRVLNYMLETRNKCFFTKYDSVLYNNR